MATMTSILNIALAVLCFSAAALSTDSHIRPKFTLNGVTVLEEPFVYGDNGKYRGFSVDIMSVIVNMLSTLNKADLDFTVRQPRDGQLGTIDKVDGIYSELLRSQTDFAIGPISRNWFQNATKASDYGLNYTDPIMVSKLSALVSRRSLENLMQDRYKQCQANMIREYKSIAGERHSSLPKIRPAELCKSNEPLTIEQLFQNREIIKIVLQNSAVHQFLRSHNWHIQDQLHIFHSEDLFTAIEMVRRDFYVLIHETTLTHYQADKDCNLATVDQVPFRLYSELKNVILDSENVLPVAMAWTAPDADGSVAFQKQELKTFENELSLIVHRRAERKYELEFNRSLVRDINQIIAQLRQSGELNKLTRKHWAQFCRKNLFNSSPKVGVSSFAAPLKLLLSAAIAWMFFV